MNDHFSVKTKIWVWFLAFLGILFLRYQYFYDVFSTLGPISLNTDTYYRLHRIQTMVNQPGFFHFAYPLKDFFLNFPTHLDVAWPLGLDLLIAGPLKWMGIHDAVSITFFSFIMIPLFIIPIVLVSASIIRKYTNEKMAILGGILVGIMPVMVDHTSLGDIDHHVIGTFIVLFAYTLLEKIRNSSRFYKSWLPLGVLLGVAPSFDPHGWFVCPLICLSLLIEKDMQFILAVGKSMFVAFIISMICLMPSDRFWEGYISVSGFSWWSSLVLFTSALFVFILMFIKQQKRMRKISWICLGLLLIVGFFYRSFVQIFIQEFINGLHWMFWKSGTIGQTFESISFIHLPVKEWGIFWFVLFTPVMMSWFVYRKKYTNLVLYSLLPILFSFFQIRFIVVSGPLTVILFVLFLDDFATFFKQVHIRRSVRVMGIALMVWCFYPSLNYIKVSTAGLIHQYFFPVRDASIFLKNYVQQNPDVTQDEFKPAVIAPWDFGNWILFFSKLPVYASPFQGEHATSVNQLLTSNDPGSFEDFQRKIPARFLMIEESIPRYYSLMEFVGKPTDDYFETTYVDGVRKISEKNEIENIFYHRFLFSLGSYEKEGFPDHWRWIYSSQYPAADIPTLPALKIFERVKGVVVKFETSQKDLYLQVRVQDQKTRFLLKKKGELVGPQTLQWIVPYGNYNHGGIFCDGNFVITDSRNRIVKKIPLISGQQVVQGDTIVVK